jgi:hypothetical protein
MKFARLGLPSLRRQGRHGIALIIILGCIAILAVVLVAFLASVKTELSSSKLYADNTSVHDMMNTCVNVVMSQIRQATTATPTDCWSSQPGLIRTFSNSGSPDMSYKLYSSGTMQRSGALNPTTEAAALANWSTQPATYTDLNDPVSGVYPIVDPTVVNLPAANAVQGFSIDSTAPTTTTQAAPMPVTWLYVLNDGTLVAPSVTGTGTTATLTGASTANPVVGRIAFWTDDETCKVNTASEGTYWDVPHFNNTVDKNLGIYQPVENEFQTYPGHPAGVSLSAVFPGLLGASTAPATENNSFYSITPRVQSGGSQNGTVVSGTTTPPVVLDADRLYDSVDEVLFTPNRTSNPASPPTPAAALTQTAVEQTQFFLTAHSVAPETTLFGTPKVACWPINSAFSSTPSTPYASAFDSLIGFCSTLNNDIYYFQRQNNESTTSDYSGISRNQSLYSYLHTLMNTQMPGFGGNLGTKFGADSDQILTEIFDYIRCTNLNDLNIPTADQYAPGVTTNSYDFGQGEVAPIIITTPSGKVTRGFGRFVTINEVGLWLICTADATNATSNVAGNLTLPTGVTLTSTATTKQLRLEAALILDPFTPMHAAVPMRPDIEILISGLDQWTIQGNNDTAPPTPNLNFPTLAQQSYTGDGILQLGPPPSYTSGNFNVGGYLGAGWALDKRAVRARNSGRLPQDANFTSQIDAASSGTNHVLNRQEPFVSEPVTVNVSTTTPMLTFSGGPITITMRERVSQTVIQTLTVNFPTTIMPAPVLSTNNLWTFQSGGCGVGTSPSTGRFGSSGTTVDGVNDVVYAMVAAQNSQTIDPRFLAMTATDSAGALFSPHPNYIANGTSTGNAANSLIGNFIEGMTYNSSGSLANPPNTGSLANLGTNKIPYRYNPCPKVPWPATAAMANGDWDNGTGPLADGGYLNEPDQANIASTTTGVSYGTPYFNDGIVPSTNFTSPSRMMPSSGMLGSLPTTFARSQAAGFTGTGNQGWQTLLFRRQPTHPSYVDSGSPTVPKGLGGFANAPDYLMMDLFWMPVVEPYAVSAALSTAGKINMNYQIIPFTYIERKTGLYAVLKHENVISVPNTDYKIYKNDGDTFSTTANYRQPIQIVPTLTQFDYRFNNSDGTGLYAFRTPSEICDVNLIPNDVGTLATGSDAAIDGMMTTYWANHALTGDNCRERPYTTIYPRLTTRSNTYRVHYRVQAIKKYPGSDAGTWTEGRDIVTSEGRGSVLIERFLDAKDTTIPDYASSPTATPTLESRYQFRILSVNRFPP